MCSLNGSRSRPQPHVPQNPVCRCLEAAEAGDLQFLQSKAQQLNGCLREEVSYCAAEAGHLEVLQWLRPQDMAPGRGTCTGAAAGGHWVVLQWAREQGCYWDEYTCAVAAGNGHLAVLQYAHQNGCAWSSWTCGAAARGGHLAVLQFAHQNGCQWNPRTCSAAAESGNLSILKWLRQHGCPWDSFTSRGAAVYGHFELLKWARQQQPPCPWWSHGSTNTYAYVLEGHNIRPDVLVFLRQQQAPLNAIYLAQARAAATRMTYAVLSLRAALPDRTPHEVVLNILNLAFS